MNKIKPILPSLKEKKRYLAFEIISKQKINNAKSVEDAINKTCLKFLGVFGMAKAGIMVLNDKYNSKKQRGLIKVSHKSVNDAKLAMCFIKKIEDKDVIVKSVGVSGILKKAEEKYIKC
ncbi:MAG: hypothetical protein KAU20_01650 [Nanoarchaeota archaeon]|nr:hypothetical protein [Nanoarchaeota archaeon]